MFFEITEDGQFALKTHAGGNEKVYKYFLDPMQMKYYLKADHSDKILSLFCPPDLSRFSNSEYSIAPGTTVT